MVNRKNNHTTQIRVDIHTKIKIDQLREKLKINEKGLPSQPEILRRTFNIPNLPDVLIEDSKKTKGGKR